MESFCATDIRGTSRLGQTALDNVDALKKAGAGVHLDVDATQLQHHDATRTYRDKHCTVIFNFPHVPSKKMKLGENRQLLKDFFVSLQQLGLRHDSHILVSLCCGQSGLPCDSVKRDYNDTWKLTEMAASGGYSLIHVRPFESLLNYESSWYRDQIGKTFQTQTGLTFTFEYRPVYDSQRPEILYPPKFEHHLSLWIQQEPWGVTELRDFASKICGDVLQSVDVIETYHSDDARVSMCFKLTYIGTKYSFSKEASNDLQNRLRAEIAAQLSNKVQVR
ncbi:Ferredoxin-fold anticodon-binding domain-containing protein 1 -like protein [Halotydeus destructor]|nr:Ferredoxin-fold anticodon-binding domain-containing protein 1 -like protein [Halotydeus destructor]